MSAKVSDILVSDRHVGDINIQGRRVRVLLPVVVQGGKKPAIEIVVRGETGIRNRLVNVAGKKSAIEIDSSIIR